MRTRLTVVLVAFLILGGVGAALANEYVDYHDHAYQEDGMHACPPGYAMGGAHVSDNDFLCRQISPPGFPIDNNDHGVQRNGMLSCPDGYYLRGYNDSQNRVLCSKPKGMPSASFGSGEFIDGGSQQYNMHVCPNAPNDAAYRGILTGINNGANKFACRYMVSDP